MIKKILFGFALIASMASCTDDYTDWATPQSNPQEDAVTFGNGSVAPVGTIDMAALADGQTLVQVCTITAPTASDEEYSAQYALTVDGTDIDMDANGNVKVADLKTYIESNYGKAPVERTLNAKVTMWVNNSIEAIKISSDEFQIKAKLDAPEIYPHLYLIGAPSEWKPTCTTLPFTRDESQSIYDNPVFTITVPVKEGETWFAFADDKTVETGEWSNVFGTREGNGKNYIGQTGFFARRSELPSECGDGSFMITVNGDAKYMKITVNVLDGTYLIEKINFAPFIYEIGNNTGWKTSNPLSGDGEGNYKGYCWMDGEYKFKPNGEVDKWDGDWEMVSDLGNNEFTFDANGNSNFPSLNGFYEMNIDLANMTAKMVEVKSITCVGNHNGWDKADAAQHMTYNKDAGCWELTTTLKDGFKFAMNDSWDVSWGGANGDPAAYDNLTQNQGKDLNVPEGEGSYKVQLYLSCEGYNKVVLTKQ